jgi:glycerophosphoryl diester phosphodiesterase
VFAHRGGADLAPENTMTAFDLGLELGADGLELDVHLARDGVAVVHHDRTLDRTTNLLGPVSARSSDELACADACYMFRPGDAFPFRGRRIGVPTLADVLARYPRVPIIVELKTSSPRLARVAVDTVRKAGAVTRVCIGSFSWRALRAVRSLDPALATSASREEVRWALYRSRLGWPVSRVSYGGYQVPEWSRSTRVVSPGFIRAAHRAGLAVQVWVVNSEADARRFLDWGVDALITDRPDLIVPFVKAYLVTR